MRALSWGWQLFFSFTVFHHTLKDLNCKQKIYINLLLLTLFGDIKGCWMISITFEHVLNILKKALQISSLICKALPQNGTHLTS